MPQDFENDFKKVALRLKQKKRKLLFQRFILFFSIIIVIASLAYFLLGNLMALILGNMPLKSQYKFLGLVGISFVFGMILYKFIIKSNRDVIRSNFRIRHNSLKTINPNFIKSVVFIPILILLLIIQANTNLIIAPINNALVHLKYQPTPATVASPWPWVSHATLHPAIASMSVDVEKSIESVAQYIAEKEPDPYLRVKALHDYVISRVSYDLDVLKTGIRPSQKASVVFKTHKAVCEGYANLFKELGKAINIKTVYVGGKIRRDLAPLDLIPATFRLVNSDYDWTLHAWNAVKISGNWYLVDTTWDDSDNTDHPSASYNTDYLMPTPAAMIKSHFPEQASWQLLANPKNESDFENQPILTPQFFIEKLDIISPLTYSQTVEKTAAIQIKHSANYPKKIIAFFEPIQDTSSLFIAFFTLVRRSSSSE